MRTRTIELEVIFATEAEDRLRIEGRCLQGPIVMSDRFRYIYRLVPQRNQKDFSGPSQRLDAEAVNLLVESIRAYSRSFEELHPGMSAEIILSGEGIDVVSSRFGCTDLAREGLALGSASL